MSLYQTALVAIDLRQESKKTLSKALELVSSAEQLQVIYVIEPITPILFGPSIDVPASFNPEEIEDLAVKQAVNKMNKLLQPFGIPIANRTICLGKSSREIKKHAKAINADVIVLGTHGQEGFELLLGSTANGVLHGSPCDVLCVQMRV